MANVIRPSDFPYLMERSLILFSSSKGSIFVTKSYFVEWVIFQDGSTIPIFKDFDPGIGENIVNVALQFR